MVDHVGWLVPIQDEVFMYGIRYFGDTIISRHYCRNIFNIVQKGMTVVYNAYTVACAVWWIEVIVASDATKCILWVFKPSFSMGVIAGNHYKVGDRVDELWVVKMSFQKRGTGWKPDYHRVIILGISLLIMQVSLTANRHLSKKCGSIENRSSNKSKLNSYSAPCWFL